MFVVLLGSVAGELSTEAFELAETLFTEEELDPKFVGFALGAPAEERFCIAGPSGDLGAAFDVGTGEGILLSAIGLVPGLAADEGGDVVKAFGFFPPSSTDSKAGASTKGTGTGTGSCVIEDSTLELEMKPAFIFGLGLNNQDRAQ